MPGKRLQGMSVAESESSGKVTALVRTWEMLISHEGTPAAKPFDGRCRRVQFTD